MLPLVRKTSLMWRLNSHPVSNGTRAYTKLLRTQRRPDKFGNTRALVTLVGQFQSSGQRKYGHLDWADSQFVIYRIETVDRLARRTLWPRDFKHQYSGRTN